MRSVMRRLAYLFRQSRLDAELREEIEAHRALRAAQLERDGRTPREAHEASRRSIGSALLAREDAREVWLGAWDTWWQDVRYGLRTFRRNPVFTSAAVLTLALGIGVTAGSVTVVNGVLFRDLPAADAHELVVVTQTVERPQGDGQTNNGSFSTSDYQVYREQTATLPRLLAVASAPMTTLGGEAPQVVFGALVSCNYFEVLGQPPALGRAPIEQDCVPGAAPVVVLAHDLWRTTFLADPAIVGRTVQLNRQAFTVVGVAASGTYGGSPARIGYFAPLSTEPLLRPGISRYADDRHRWLQVIGRRAGRTPLAHVQAELEVIAAQLDRQEPGRSTGISVERATAMTGLPVPVARASAVGAASILTLPFGLVLLIACANVSNLLLTRGTARSQEIGVRLALGATRARVVRQLLTESLLIALAGGLIGSILAFWAFEALVMLALPALLPPELPMAFAWDLSPDGRVLAFAVALTMGTGLVVGLAPALHVSKRDPNAVMKLDAAVTGSGPRGGRLRAALVGVQVTLCMALAIAAGLLLRGLYATYTVAPGFEYRDVTYVSFEPVLGAYDDENISALRQRIQTGIEALPGVEVVAWTDREPLGDDSASIGIRRPGEPGHPLRRAQLHAVGPDYFTLLRLPIVRGRTFTESEVASTATDVRPAVVSEATARNLWSDADPLGQTLLWGAGADRDVTLHIVGVAADAQLTAIGHIDPYSVFVPTRGSAVLLVRSRGGYEASAADIRRVVTDVEPVLAASVFPLEATLAWWRSISGTVTAAGGAVAMLALMLASVGVFGVVSYSVTRRYQEIGIRVALGATARNVLGTILRQTMRPVAVGASIGLVAMVALSGVLSSVLFGVSPADPIGLGGAALLVIAVALAAGVTAARPVARAAAVSPVAAIQGRRPPA